MKKVLIADDDNYYFNIMKNIYESNGYQVARACSARQSWELIRNNGMEYYHVFVYNLSIRKHMPSLSLLFKMRFAGFKSPIYFSSNLLNLTFNYFISGSFLKMLGIQRLIPKNNFHIMDSLTLERFFI